MVECVKKLTTQFERAALSEFPCFRQRNVVVDEGIGTEDIASGVPDCIQRGDGERCCIEPHVRCGVCNCVRISDQIGILGEPATHAPNVLVVGPQINGVWETAVESE